MNKPSSRPLGTVAILSAIVCGVLLPTPVQAGVADASSTPLSARLTASGDADGSGHAALTFKADRKKVCATIHWSGIETPDYAHIHQVSDGSIVVDLTGAVTGGAKCTKGVPSATIKRILNKPGKYYVNVHNAAYPAGAIQGKLRR